MRKFYVGSTMPTDIVLMDQRRHVQLAALVEGNAEIKALRNLAWHGASALLRPSVWQLLLGYLPLEFGRRDSVLRNKRSEYASYVQQIYNGIDSHSTEKTRKDMKQIDEDIPRTQPDVPLFRTAQVQETLRRILFIWAVRHPASGYVQGINDMCSVLILVFLQGVVQFDVEREVGDLPDLTDLEADCYGCLRVILGQVADYFYPSSPGIQRAVLRIEEIIQRLDIQLARHMRSEDLPIINFSFRWFNCLLVREFSLRQLTRLWDCLLSQENGLSEFTVYICASMVLKWANELKKSNFADMMLFLQNLPTQMWTNQDVDELISQAYVNYQLFGAAPSHLKQTGK